ncbi:HAD-like domain-containing protein [Lineolata rhizophorae]|uniref:phosphoserine phosphatase n=1 Tax=Lineolata rhizophorae TaxID=578093 RepID=A0A6A6P427_9PEZI|nr:HAD-like domain-containing protein [Lineolata rhizophorae]
MQPLTTTTPTPAPAPPPRPKKIVATLFYKSTHPRHPQLDQPTSPLSPHSGAHSLRSSSSVLGGGGGGGGSGGGTLPGAPASSSNGPSSASTTLLIPVPAPAPPSAQSPLSPRSPTASTLLPDHHHRTSRSEASLQALSEGAVPTDDMSQYPLEPPPAEATGGQLDRLFGGYVSRSCLTAFEEAVRETIAAEVGDGAEDPAGAPGEGLEAGPETAGMGAGGAGGGGETTTGWTTRALDAEPHPRVVEVTFPVPAGISAATLRRADTTSRFELSWSVEAVFQPASVHRTHKRLAVFDMDSTLIAQEVIDEVARAAGVAERVAALTAAAMNGDVDFETSLRQRCALLAGVPATVWDDVKRAVDVVPGARALVRALRRLGVRTAVLSGGFEPMAAWLAAELGLDRFAANALAVSPDGAALTGELVGPIVHAARKRDLVRRFARDEGALLAQTLVVGDGANDLLMMEVAGLGVAVNAKARVQLEAPARLNTGSLTDVLYLLGLTEEEQEELLLEEGEEGEGE